MTTEFHTVHAADLFVDNDVIVLGSEQKASRLELAGATWLTSGVSVSEAHRRSLRHATTLAVRNLPEYELWLLAGTTAWQPDSSMTRHRKLWGASKARGLAMPAGRVVGESIVESAEGIRYFSALQLGLDSIDAAVAILEVESVSHVVALKGRNEERDVVMARSRRVGPIESRTQLRRSRKRLRRKRHRVLVCWTLR